MAETGSEYQFPSDGGLCLRWKHLGELIDRLGSIAANPRPASTKAVREYAERVATAKADFNHLLKDTGAYIAAGKVPPLAPDARRVLTRPVLVVDTETTGLPHQDWAQVIEIAALHLDEYGRVVNSFQSLLGVRLDDRCTPAMKINGITQAELDDAPLPQNVRGAFLEWFHRYVDHGVTVTSYNLAFDEAMLNRAGFSPLPWGECIMLQATQALGNAGVLEHKRKRDGGFKYASLDEACAYYKVVGRAHRAFPDAQRAAAVLLAMENSRGAL